MAAGVRLEPNRDYALAVTLYLFDDRRDRDNILKSIMDGLQALDYGWNDRQITDISVRTVRVADRSEEKAEVTLEAR